MSSLDRIDAWRQISAPRFQPLLAELAALSGDCVDPALVTRLRGEYPIDVVAVALELAQARRRARTRFPQAERLLADVEGVAQASGAAVAAHKAVRFRGAQRMLDLCCGIGGDTMALAAVGISTGADLVGIDAAPARVVMAAHNAAVEIQEAEVTAALSTSVAGAYLHIDPSRRQGGRRLWSYRELQPGPEVVEPLLAAAAGAALKLGPGVDWTEIPERQARECEVIGSRAGLLQAVIWCGDLAQSPGQHTATRLQDGATFTAPPGGDLDVAAVPGRFLLIPDPALERARLVAARIGEGAVEELAAGLGWLTSEASLGDPWFEEYEILAHMAWRPRKIRDWLRAHNGGAVTARSRAGAIQTDREQLALRGEGAVHHTVFGVRQGKRVVCYIARAPA